MWPTEIRSRLPCTCTPSVSSCLTGNGQISNYTLLSACLCCRLKPLSAAAMNGSSSLVFVRNTQTLFSQFPTESSLLQYYPWWIKPATPKVSSKQLFLFSVNKLVNLKPWCRRIMLSITCRCLLTSSVKPDIPLSMMYSIFPLWTFLKC